MWLTTWLRNQSSPHARKRLGQRRRPVRVRPRIEVLEDRTVPSQISLTVSSLADSGTGTLRAAILAADAGNHSDKFTIGFAVTGTIDLQSPLPDLNNNITVQGPGASSLTVERAAGYSFSSAIVTVDTGQTVSISGLTIANGNASGIVDNGTLTLTSSAISNNLGGGGVGVNGTLTMSGCTISGNTVNGDGGGIHGIHGNGTVTIDGSIITNNSAAGDGGGIWMDGGTLTVTNSTISSNHANGSSSGINGFGEGGGIYGSFFVPSTISSCSIKGNTAATFGGGLWIGGVSAAGTVVSGCTLSGNSVTGQVFYTPFSVVPIAGNGGGIYNGTLLTVSGCTLTANSANSLDVGGTHYAGRGGGMFNAGLALRHAGVTTLRDSYFILGNSAELGGGIYNNDDGETLDIEGSTFSGNSATKGGAIYNTAFGTLEVHGSTFTSNTASDSGGALFNLGTATVQESTLSGNTAANDGGGIFNGVSGALMVKDSTVLNNAAPLGADIYNLGILTLNDSTVGVIGP